MKAPTAFTLEDDQGQAQAFPTGTGRPALVALVKEDCACCNLTLPQIEALRESAGDRLDVLVLAQQRADLPVLRARHGLSMPLLDDSALDVSYDAEIDTVPSLFLYGADGLPALETYGFDKQEWQAIVAEALALAGVHGAPPAIDWAALPASYPGCGAKNVEPGTYEKLQARKSGDLLSRRIEIAEHDDVHEFLFDQGFTDGLPVVPPTPERVWRMLQGTTRRPHELLTIVPPNMAEASVEKVAINAVMAGCKPEYLPVVLAAVEAACTDEFNAHGVWATTMGAAPAMIINGPIRHRLGLNMRLGALGQGNRANATIGRALRLCMRNIGGAQPGATERSTFGGPHKFTLCFAEWEEEMVPWEPLHVERGFAPEDDVVTLVAVTGGPSTMVDQTARSAHQLAGSFAHALDAQQDPKAPMGDILVVVGPEHVDVLRRDGWSKQDLREAIMQRTSHPLRERLQDDDWGGGIPRGAVKPDADLDAPVAKFGAAANIHLVVAGSKAGKFSAILAGWATGPRGSQMTSRKITG